MKVSTNRADFIRLAVSCHKPPVTMAAPARLCITIGTEWGGLTICCDLPTVAEALRIGETIRAERQRPKLTKARFYAPAIGGGSNIHSAGKARKIGQFDPSTATP